MDVDELRRSIGKQYWSLANAITAFAVLQSLAFVYALAEDSAKIRSVEPIVTWAIAGSIVVYVLAVALCHRAQTSTLPQDSRLDSARSWLFWTMVGRAFAIVLFGAFGLAILYGTPSAPNVEEIINRVRQAARTMADQGTAPFDNPSAISVWDGTPIWAIDCSNASSPVLAAHPRLGLKDNGTSIASQFVGPKDPGEIARDICTTGGRQTGGWVEYNVMEGPTEVRIVSYQYAVPGKPFIAAAGIPDDRLVIADLDRLAGDK